MVQIGPVGLPELIVILLILLVIFGPHRLVDMARSMGLALKEFRKSLQEEDEESAKKKGP